MYDVIPERAINFQGVDDNIISEPGRPKWSETDSGLSSLCFQNSGKHMAGFQHKSLGFHDSGYHSESNIDTYRRMYGFTGFSCDKGSEDKCENVSANFCENRFENNGYCVSENNCENSANCGIELLSEHLRSVDLTGKSDQTDDLISYTDECVTRTAFSQDSDGDTVLHSAIIALKEPLALGLINMAPCHKLLNIKNRLWQTSLHLAVLTKQASVVRRLVVGGADITARDGRGNTPLHIACREGHVEVARALMEPVRYPETKQNSYDIPYQRIPQNLLLVNYEGRTALHIAASHGHLDIVTLLLEKHADINVRDVKSGRTILHMACEEGHLELVTMLLKCKQCDINAKTYNGLTPFDLARDRGHVTVTYELALAGASREDEEDMDEY